MLSGEFPKLFQVKKIGAVENIANPLVVTNSYKFTSLCVVDMMIICSIYFHSYGYMRLATCPYFCAATKKWFPLLPLESCCKSDKSFTYCLFVGNSLYMCIQSVYISVYIYIYIYIYIWIPRPSNVKLGTSLKRQVLAQKTWVYQIYWSSFLVGDHEVFAAMNLDVDTHMNWFDFIFYPNLNLKCLKLSVKLSCQTIVTFRWWSSPSIWQEISVTQLQWFFVFLLFPPMSLVYRELGRFRSWIVVVGKTWGTTQPICLWRKLLHLGRPKWDDSGSTTDIYTEVLSYLELRKSLQMWGV